MNPLASLIVLFFFGVMVFVFTVLPILLFLRIWRVLKYTEWLLRDELNRRSWRDGD